MKRCSPKGQYTLNSIGKCLWWTQMAPNTYITIWLVEFRLFCGKQYFILLFKNLFIFENNTKDTLRRTGAPKIYDTLGRPSAYMDTLTNPPCTDRNASHGSGYTVTLASWAPKPFVVPTEFYLRNWDERDLPNSSRFSRSSCP